MTQFMDGPLSLWEYYRMRPSTAMNAARHKIINLKHLNVYVLTRKHIWYNLTWYFFFFFKKKYENRPQSFRRVKGQVLLNFECEKIYQDFWKNNRIFVNILIPYLLDKNILPANFRIQCMEMQSDIELKETFNNVSLY